MFLQVVGCSHHNTAIEVREKLAFSPEQSREALDRWQRVFPQSEAVLLSTCNRVEIYTAGESDAEPELEQAASFLADFHEIDSKSFIQYLYLHNGEEAVKHLFAVASSLDSMVVGEPQILAQVKDAYQTAMLQGSAGPLLHAMFQAALHVARRVANETAVHQQRVSIPSVAVADFGRQIFERFDDKHVVVIGAGEMAAETLRYLREQGSHQITIVNRSYERASELAPHWHGRAVAWDQLLEAIATADLIISTTGASEPIVRMSDFERIERARFGRPLFILDLGVPRDFEAAIGDRPNVYLYSIDDLREACRRNKSLRDKELPDVMQIIEQEIARFMADWRHRAVGPVIEQLRQGWQKPKEDEIERLFNKLPNLDEHSRDEIRRSFNRLVNKLLHPPLESLRDESRKGVPRFLMEALAKLFKLKD
jgi:glutamyl-tRNA reductase